MAIKYYAEHIERLSLMPVRSSPNGYYCFNVRVVFTEQYFQAYAAVVLCGKNVIVHLESRIFFRSAVGAANIRQHIEALFVLEKRAGLVNVISRNKDGKFAKRKLVVSYPTFVFGLHLIYQLGDRLTHISI